jgi:hypothetical protein
MKTKKRMRRKKIINEGERKEGRRSRKVWMKRRKRSRLRRRSNGKNKRWREVGGREKKTIKKYKKNPGL